MKTGKKRIQKGKMFVINRHTSDELAALSLYAF